MAASIQLQLLDLPNELLLHVLTSLRTTQLLPIATVCHRFYVLISRLFQYRLSLAANPAGHTILLECYHPSRRLLEPALYCEYLGTPGLDCQDDLKTPIILGAELQTSIGELKRLQGLYSHFKPYRHPSRRRPPMRHPAGDVPGSRTFPASDASPLQRQESEGDNVQPLETFTQTLHLDSHETFSQLCSSTNLVRLGPKPGLFRSFGEIDEGVVRVFRRWLGAIAERQLDDADSRVLWIKDDKNVGIKMGVEERRWRRDAPVLFREEEVGAVYDIRYEELLIKTSHLLTKLEQSLARQEAADGKAIVFGTFERD